jgi:hypothetical protein
MSTLQAFIHRSAWKRNSPKFAFRGFREVAPSWENGPVVNRAEYVAVLSSVSPRFHG